MPTTTTTTTKIDWTVGDYAFKSAGPTDSRSPCPALNALSNHSILPHDGRDLSILQVTRAIKQVYNLSFPLALLLTLGGFLLCGHAFHTKLHLHDLAKHNKVEHDGSLVHDNAGAGNRWAPTSVNRGLLDELITEGITAAHQNGHDGHEKNATTTPIDSGEGLTLYSFALARTRRDTTLTKPLSFLHRTFARGESAFTLLTLGDARGVVSPSLLRTWFGEERLPDGWTGNLTGWKVGVSELNTVAKRVGQIVDHLKQGV